MTLLAQQNYLRDQKSVKEDFDRIMVSEYYKFKMHTHLTFKVRGYIFQWHCSGALFLIYKIIKLT